MKQNDLSRYRERFNLAVDKAIKECSRSTGITDLDTVYQYLKTSSSMLVKRLKALLADDQIRVIIQKRLKHCTVSVEEAAQQASKNLAQTEFDFFGMEQFRGVSQRITYPEGKAMKYVEYNRSLEWQRELSIAHLDSGILADIARRDAEIAGNQFLHPLVKKYGDTPAEDLIGFWLRDQGRSADGASAQ
jgi:predicted aldo/keto reductase-like oxidoreductase